MNPRVGTDAALALAMCNVIVEEGLQKKRYVQEQTDLPFLLREDTGRFLRQSDLAKDGKDDIFYIWDLATKTLQEAPGTNGQPEASIDLGDLDPAMEGEYEIELLDGRNVTVRPAFMALKKRLDEYTPERAAEITGVGAGMIRRLARQVAESPATMIFCSWGSCKHYHMDLVQRSIILLLALTGNTGKRGAGMRIGAWWNMSLSYDKAGVGALAAAGGDAERPKVRDVENIIKGRARPSRFIQSRRE